MRSTARRPRALFAMTALLFLAACTSSAPAPPAESAPTAGGSVARSAGVGAAAAAPVQPTPAAPARVALGRAGSGPAPQFWAGYVADRKSFFKDEAIEFEFVAVQSAFNLTQAVIAGELQVINFTVLSMAAAVSGGAPLKLVASTQDVPTIEVIAPPEIRTWADLKGKTVIGGNSPGDYFDVALRMMMAANGLQDGDYVDRTMPSAARLPTLQAGQAAASIASDRDVAVAQTQGYRSLGALNDYVKDIQYAGLLVDDGWARTQTDVLVRFLRALLRGSAWLFDPANKDEAKRIYAEVADLDVAQVEDIYVDMIDRRMLSRTLRPNLTGIDNVLAIAHQQGALDQIPPLDTWVDLRYLEQASR
jgi:ABC-type nitrate/sulfonate/bicarbonate transport system substrate-binding protein